MKIMKTFYLVKPLALITIFFLFTELLSPLAFAQPLPPLQVQEKPLEPKASEASALRKEAISFFAPAASASTAAPGSTACLVHEITAADRQRLWDNTMGFTPTEINDLPLAEALGNQPGQFQNPMTQPWAPVVGQVPQDIRLIDLALLGIDPAQAAKDLCKNNKKCLDKYVDKEGKVYAEATIPLSTAQQYAAMKGRANAANPVLEQLKKFGLYGGQVGVALPTPTPLPYENLKVGVPGSNETRLSDLFKARAINPDTCILDESIQGRVTYMALLDEDVCYGTVSKECLSGEYTSPATNKKDEELSDEDFHQAFSGSEVLGYLMLNGGSNILIPSFYEYWLKTVNKINSWEFWTSLIVGVGAGAVSKNLASLAASRNKQRQELIAKGALYEGVGRMQVNDPQFFNTLIDSGKKDAAGNAIYYTVREGFAEDAAESLREIRKGEAALENYVRFKDPFDKAKNIAVPYLTASIMLGMGWLGPGRLLYEVNAGLILKAAGKRNNQYVKVFVNKAVARGFKEASDPFGVGGVQELLSKFTGLGVPDKAFNVGPVFLINYPSPIDVVQESHLGTTTIQNIKGRYAIYTKWYGPSYALNFEDVRGFGENDKYTSLPLVTNKLLPETTINKKVQGNVYKYITAAILPVIISRGIGAEIGRVFGVAAALYGFEVAMRVDENYGKGLECSADEIEKIKKIYTLVLGVGSALQLTFSLSPSLLYAFKVLKTKPTAYAVLHQVLSSVGDVINYVNPVIAAQLYWGNKAMQYVSNCVDSQYKILAYQALPGTIKKKATGLQEKLSPIQDITEKLKLAVAAKESLQPSERPLDKMTEILNFKTQIDDQRGLVAPSEIYYLQIEQSVFSVKSSLWDLLAKQCRENYQDASKTAALGVDGVALYDKQGRLLAAFADRDWRLRALARMRSQENARVILPNKFIETTLNCGDKPFVTINTGGSALLKNDDCGATKCLRQKIKEVTGNEVKEDLSSVLGKISSVDTSKGIASFEGTSIRFTNLLAAKGEKAGVQETVPSMEDYEKLVGVQLEGSQLDVLGNGQVVLNGPVGGTVKNQGIGTLKTIIGSRGKIEYNAADRSLLVFIYTLAEASVQGISSISASASNNMLADGTQVPAVKLDARDKTGVQTGVPEALKQVQGPGGMQSLETADHVYYFTQDAQGNPILRVIDKKTGQATDYKITGPITRDAQGNLVVPTDKGPLTLGVGMQNGQPMLTAKGLGIDELLPLLVARGQNGILTFNPSTGAINVYNGQDIPLSPEFANKGIGFTGDEAGNTRGIPQSNYFGPRRTTGAAAPSAGLLALSSWPEDVALALLMVSLVLVGVAVVRRSERKENEVY